MIRSNVRFFLNQRGKAMPRVHDDVSNPRHHCQLTYRLEAQHIVVEQTPGVVWLKISVDAI